MPCFRHCFQGNPLILWWNARLGFTSHLALRCGRIPGALKSSSDRISNPSFYRKSRPKKSPLCAWRHPQVGLHFTTLALRNFFVHSLKCMFIHSFKHSCNRSFIQTLVHVEHITSKLKAESSEHSTVVRNKAEAMLSLRQKMSAESWFAEKELSPSVCNRWVLNYPYATNSFSRRAHYAPKMVPRANKNAYLPFDPETMVEVRILSSNWSRRAIQISVRTEQC